MQSESYQWSSSVTAPPPDYKSSPYNSIPSNLKRQRSDLSIAPLSSGTKMSPPIPRLNGDVILDVFTHRSLRFHGAPPGGTSGYGDGVRLAVLGEKALECAVTDTLFKKQPLLEPDQIKKERDDILSNKLEGWVKEYKLRDKLRCSPDAAELLDSAQEMSLLFQSYVGAVFATQGMSAVQNWIGALVDPTYESVDTDMEPANYPKKVKTEAFSPPPSAMYSPYNAPPEPTAMPPPPPPSNPPPPLPMSNSSMPAQPTTAFLPMFNQTANQRRVFVEYPAQFSGPPHAGKWLVKCVVNGIEKGAGAGASKQLAKEEAAKQAWFALGWGPRA